MWELYERLIEPIPDDVPVDEIIVGTSCTMVRAGGAAGAAANQRLESRPRILEEEEWERGMTWRQAASPDFLLELSGGRNRSGGHQRLL